MLKHDLFIAAMNAGCFRYKRWVIEAFSLVQNRATHGEYPFQITEIQGQYGIRDPQSGEVELIEGTSTKEPLFRFRDSIDVKAGDIPNLKKAITTTYGNVFVNYLCLVYPFGSKIDYLEGPITIKQIEKIIEARLMDDPKEGTSLPPDALTVSEYIRFNEAALSLAGFTQLSVPAGSAKTLMTDPQVYVRRAELLIKYKDQLNDPAIQARISDELIALDKAWVKADPASEGFFLKDKSFDVVRKRMYLMLGAESGFGVQGELIARSLDEGWDPKHLPAMNNSHRDGSFNRGAQTALGGEATKFNYRIFQNTTVVGEDCGTKLGLPVLLTKDIIDGYMSSSVITAKGVVELTKENREQFVEKLVMLRSPAYCTAEAPSFCATCIGKRIASTPSAIGTYAADVGSKFMSLFLAATHGTALKTKNYLLEQSIE